MAKQPSMISTPLIDKPVKFGLIILGLFFGGFFLWSVLAPIESAAVAPGKVTVDTNTKVIQHLEGGIVKTLNIRDGSAVKRGDVLIELENTQAKASFDLVHKQANELLAAQARLTAERDGLEQIAFPERLVKESSDPYVKRLIESQERVFKNNRKALQGRLDILNARIVQLEKEIESLNSQVESEGKQLKLINEEIEAVAYLEKKKLIEKPRLLSLQREAARLAGNRGEHLGMIAKTQQRIGETQTQILSVRDDERKKTLQELRETRQRLGDVLEKEKSAADILARTQIRAPIPGKVVNLLIHTEGGVITPGEDVMSIVPSEDELVIEARVDPLDIDIVHVGLTAKVNFVAFKSRSTPTLVGSVIHVSADSYEDKQTGASYYKARINIPKEELDRLGKLKLYPGMPAQVMIITDKRSAFQYFVTPIRESFGRAFREQ